MLPFAVPARLAEAVASSGSPAMADWLARLPAVVRTLADRWSLTVDAPFRPGGAAAWVAPARDAAGRELVLKVGWRHEEAEHEADGLRAWHGRGAVELHDAHVDGPTSSLLLQRCLPGTALNQALPEPDQDEVVAGLLRRLWHEPPTGDPFRPLSDLCDSWADAFEDHRQDAARAGEPDRLDDGLVRAGLGLFRALPREPVPAVLLATDLHAGNVLAHGQGWFMIDPKPYVGDPAYDVLQHLLNCDRLAVDPRGLARRMADHAHLDAERVTSWLFARTVQQSLTQPWLRPVAVALAPHG